MSELLSKPKFIELPKITDDRGNLTFLQSNDQIPFIIQRIFWTFDVPGGEIRGGHAYFKQEEIIIALSGSFDVIVNNGTKDSEQIKYSLNRSNYALYIPPLTWRHMENFSTNALSLHISSTTYNENDYIRDYETYIKLSNKI